MNSFSFINKSRVFFSQPLLTINGTAGQIAVLLHVQTNI